MTSNDTPNTSHHGDDLARFGDALGDDMRSLAGTLDLDPDMGDRISDRADGLARAGRRRVALTGLASVVAVLAVGSIVLQPLLGGPTVAPIAPVESEAGVRFPVMLTDAELDAMTLEEVQAQIARYEAELARLETIAATDPDIGAGLADEARFRFEREIERLHERLEELRALAEAAADSPDGAPTTSPTPVDAEPGYGTWTQIPDGPINAPTHAVWTGTELLVAGWCGEVGCGSDPLAAYDPITQTWTELAAPSGEWISGDGSATGGAVWTGEQMLIIGGDRTTEPDPDIPGDRSVAGYAYHRATDTWTEIPEAPLAERTGHTIVWTGTEAIVWGGAVVEEIIDSEGLWTGVARITTYADGAAYDPATKTWRTIAASPLASRTDHGAVWADGQMLIMGGGDGDTYESEYHLERDLPDGAAYDPIMDTWGQVVSVPGAGASGVATVWLDAFRLAFQWNGEVSSNRRDLAGAGPMWDPDLDEVYDTPQLPDLDWLRASRTPVVFAAEIDAVLTWGGHCGEYCNRSNSTGAALDVPSGTWTTLPASPLGSRAGHVMAWTGTQLLIIGGRESDPPDYLGHRSGGYAWTPPPTP